ncbi:MAG: carbon starvation protein A [Myxococcaceae bacterium]
MTLPLLAAMVIGVLVLGYRFYGGYVARQFQLDPKATTPAVRLQDNQDFVPTRPFYLFGQHFSAIAAAGPIAGPILAAQQFGWLPAILWIGLGVVFIGAVHDFSTLVASVRHDARSVAEVIRTHLGPRSGAVMLAFIWIALLYVIIAFADVTASTFVRGDAELRTMAFAFHPGGAVALGSVLYLGLSMVMGVVERFLKPPLWLTTLIFVPLTLVAVWVGTKFSTVLLFGNHAWVAAILVYCLVASLTPVWLLLQPRGYLGGFILYLSLAAGVVGVFFGGFSIQQPAIAIPASSVGPMFPFLFVTIACGACSGFHGLVCSGTTSKQVARETHCRPVGYGAMLLEAFVALVALSTLLIAAPGDIAGKAPGAIYGEGLGRFIAIVVGEEHLVFAQTFGAMAFSTFVFDTLDVSTRLGRYIVQELLNWRNAWSAFGATAVTVAVPYVLISMSGPGAWATFWTLFGTSNQLLAALSLVGVMVWLKRSGRRYAFVLWPLLGVAAVTATSLVWQIGVGLLGSAPTAVQRINGSVALVLLVMAVGLLVSGIRAMGRSPTVLPTAVR